MRPKLQFAGLAALASCAFSTMAWANGPPIQSENAFTTGLNGAAVRTFVRATRLSGDAGSVEVLAVPLVFPYELVTNRLIVAVGIPTLSKTFTAPDSSERSSGYGIGDVFISSKVRLFQSDGPGTTFRVAAKLQLSTPTGETDAEDDIGRLPPGLQRGSGKFAPSGLVVFTWLRRRFGLNGDLGYKLVPSKDGVDTGDQLVYDVALAYRVLPSVYDVYPAHQVNLMLEANGSWRGKDVVGGLNDNDSGGYSTRISPGLQYMYDRIIVEASVQIPLDLASSSNGNQLTADWTALLGARWLFFN